ncbi:MAG: 4'-phosphopantetheinyl transferase family protein [Pseudomonadota bacterium]
MADPASAALTGPQLFSGHPGHDANEAEGGLNDAERARASTMTDPSRRLAFVTARRLWRQGARRFAQAHGLALPDFSQLPARGAITPVDAPFRSSLCHTGSLILAGFNRAAIGVDAEPLDRQAEWERLASRWFAGPETEWLHAHPEPEAAFLRLWTLKEAWIKATGRGIAGNLQALVLDPDNEKLVLDQPGPGWRAATTSVQSHRVSVIWQGVAEPDWWHESGSCQAQWQFPEVEPQ